MKYFMAPRTDSTRTGGETRRLVYSHIGRLPGDAGHPASLQRNNVNSNFSYSIGES